MELQFYYYVAYFFIALFVIYLIILLSRINFKDTLEGAITDHYVKEDVKKLVEKGFKRYNFENGRVSILAKSFLHAMLEYKISNLRKSHTQRRALKSGNTRRTTKKA
jgi:hypothetical protein